MKNESEALEAVLELVRAADPLQFSEGEQPDTEAALRMILATVPVSRPHKLLRRRRVLTLGGVAVAAAVAAFVVFNLAPSGSGGVGSVLDQTGVLVSPARAAQILARVQRALTHFGPDEIIVWKAVSQQTGGGPASSWTQSQWESTSSPYRELVTWTSETSRGPSEDYSEGSTALDIDQFYDPSRNIIYEPTVKPAWSLARGPRPGTWTLKVPRARIFTQLARRLPPALRGTVQLTISDSQARALRSGAKEVVYNHPYARSTQSFSIFTRPMVGTYANITGYGRPEVPASWAAGLKSHGVRVRLHGQSAIEITAPAQSTTYWFSTSTLYPLEEVVGIGKNRVTTRFVVYEVLRGAAASTSLLSLQHAHPSARIVVGERAFEAAGRRLGAS